MHYLVPDTNAALLSKPSKMPSCGFGLPAHKACPRANGTICDKKHCYACKGFYRMSNVQRTQEIRFKWTVQSLRTAEGFKAWVALMVAAITAATAKHEKLFRWHDSGDMFSVLYVRAIIEVCRQTPTVKHWLPSRVWQLPTGTANAVGLKPFQIVGSEDALFAEVLKLAALPNVTVRPSALNFEDAPPVIPGLAAGTAACETRTFGYRCPAPQQNNTCGNCRVCWNNPEIPVTYHRH